MSKLPRACRSCKGNGYFVVRRFVEGKRERTNVKCSACDGTGVVAAQ
ncbi:hypothetical protein [Nonomuraea sp. SYSU D8015]|nr:hypothetical protein [Nonomuraea sp. SYSU D8015]